MPTRRVWNDQDNQDDQDDQSTRPLNMEVLFNDDMKAPLTSTVAESEIKAGPRNMDGDNPGL